MTRRSLVFASAAAAFAQQGPADLDRVKVGQTPPPFELPSADGGKVSLASLRGSNVLLVFYRAVEVDQYLGKIWSRRFLCIQCRKPLDRKLECRGQIVKRLGLLIAIQ